MNLAILSKTKGNPLILRLLKRYGYIPSMTHQSTPSQIPNSQKSTGQQNGNNGLQNVKLFQIEDYERLFALMSQYRDRPMDLADATLVIAAEKTGIKQILTLDSDFLFYRSSDRHSFDVIFLDDKR